MLKTNFSKVHQDSCLRGGAFCCPRCGKLGMGCTETLATPKMQKGDDGSVDIGAAILFKLAERKLGYSRPERLYTSSSTSRDATRDVVGVSLALYAPLLQSAVPTLLQTVAYRKPVKGSDELGTVAEFTSRLKKGYD